ncbi:uncharacterized protein [Anomalospiza imberbis]|uniref:uncharacterized protein n=1 Tax=Anomalospiza imberbis TaxID=187417 RepID=UPI00358F7B9D
MEQRPPRVPKLAWVGEEEDETSAILLDLLLEKGVSRPEQVSSLWPCFNSLMSHMASPATPAGPCEPLRPSQCGGKGSTSLGTLGTSLPLAAFHIAPCLLQVPAMVRYIHQWLMANDSAEHRLNRTLLHLAEAQPNDAVMTLLRVAPSCDRAAMAMWKTIMSSPRTAKLAQRILLDVLGSWPKHSTRTSDGDKTGVFALAATVVMWKILQEPCVPHIVKVHSSRVLVHLLFQVFYSTEETPEEVDTFWKGCQEQHGLATSPNRFALRTLKSLLCLEQYKDVVMAMERRCGWDTLLCADTQHYAVGLLAREMSCISIRSCSRIFRYLLQLLSTQEPRWDLPALAFLVEVSLLASAASLSCLPALCPLVATAARTVSTPCAAAWAQPCAVLGSCRPRPLSLPRAFQVLKHLDLSEREADRVLQIFSRHLQSECRERRRLALKGLLKLTDNPSTPRPLGQ